MTGELFALLRGSSLLAPGGPGASEAEGFAAGLSRAEEDGTLSAALFEARAAQLVDGRTAGWANGFVSGLLIGAEIAAMDPQQPVLAIGDPALVERYEAVLARRGVRVRRLDGEACAIAGLERLDDD
jgi:2-dehydro-3-deoxygalactonokinase